VAIIKFEIKHGEEDAPEQAPAYVSKTNKALLVKTGTDNFHAGDYETRLVAFRNGHSNGVGKGLDANDEASDCCK